MSRQPSVAIVIPAYNEERLIGKCLQSCIDQTSQPDEIIIVNNKSTDDTVSRVRRYQEENPHIEIRLLNQNEHQGIAPTRNYGFDHARSDVLGRIDADSIIASDWVEKIRRCFRDPAVDAATGPVLYYDMPLRRFGFRSDHMIRKTLHRKAKNDPFLLGANMAIRGSVWAGVRHLTRLDLADELHEDIDLALTLAKNDFEIAYESTMVAGMSGRRLENSPRDYYQYIMRYARTAKAHGVKSKTARMTILLLILTYFPLRTLRLLYDCENSRFTLSKLGDELRKAASLLLGGRMNGSARRFGRAGRPVVLCGGLGSYDAAHDGVLVTGERSAVVANTPNAPGDVLYGTAA